jgi:hypothetical protein
MDRPDRSLYRTPEGDMVNVSARMPATTSAWVYELAAKHEATLSATAMQLLEDWRTWWGISKEDRKVLRADARALGLSERDYVYYLLRRRALKLLQERSK